MGLFSKITGMLDNGELKKYRKIADKVVALESEYAALSDEALKDKTAVFRSRYAAGETLDSLLPEAFAAVREAAKRVRGMTPFYVQIMGGIILHEGNIAEMKTGEGKTLTAMMPAYLNALAGTGVHIVTVNEYLASRDSVWMGDILRFLGLSVGLILREQTPSEKRAAYGCDVTYATNNELGFDYLRDNMAMRMEDLVQRELSYAIVDEVDSILIDEARTPLIISGSGQESSQEYKKADTFVRRLTEGEDNDYKIDEKAKTATLTEAGIAKAESWFSVENLMDLENIELLHHINQALKANYIMKRDVDYVVNDGEIVIVDEFTGRLMPGRRYNEGLHQAIEAKEKMKVNRESVTMATITFQNFFRMYGKLSGMTGTAKTEENEFKSIYGMDVVCVPTNKPMIRDDMNDLVYRTEAGKFNAVVEDIERRHALGQPLLVGTISIEKSEYLSRLLTKRRIPHTVLNAKNHQKEAEIIAQAGQMNAVTISTNMAGRGTDIVLGEGVVGLGGLHVIGTERHESRRIDNQLRGRSGRQGDPGSSQFYISLEDDLMRLFGSERMQSLVAKVGMDDSTAIEAGILTRGIESAQKNVEGRNFGIRKNVLQYDDVMNKQREVIYAQRKMVLRGDDISELILKMIDSASEGCVETYTHVEDGSPWDMAGLSERIAALFGISVTFPERCEPEEMAKILSEAAKARREERIKEFGAEIYLNVERAILLRVVDSKWMEHIDNMDQLRSGIGLRAYAQTNPINAYTKEGFEMFEDMNASIVEDTIGNIFRFTIREEKKQEEKVKKAPALMTNQVKEEKVKVAGAISKNAPCPCGSGKKYKRCCGKDKFND